MRKEFLYGVLCAAAVAVSFGGGYLTGKTVNAKRVPPVNENKEISTQTIRVDDDYEEIIAEQNEIGIYYILKDENKSLRLYKIDGEQTTLVKEIEFDTKYLPAEDRQRLENGIKLEDLEDGYELIEDFIS